MFLSYIDPGTGFNIASGAALLATFILSFLTAFLLFFRKIFKFIKQHKKNIFIIITTGAIIVVILARIFMNKDTDNFEKRIIILGLDGLSPNIVEGLMKKGNLPNFTKLKEKGSYRHLSTTNPSQSPVAWSSFATGKNPGKHGLFDFIKRNPKNYMLEISQTNIDGSNVKSVKTIPSFWHYTSLKRIPTVIITCPVTFPPDKIYGRMLSGMGVPDILGTQGTFAFYTSEHLEKDKDIGGKVFEITKKPVMYLELIGPKKSTPMGKSENTRIPFIVHIKENGIYIDLQKNHIQLEEKQWSDWINVEFKVNLFRKIKGILRLYLVEKFPEFKLYISPINFDPRDPFFQISYPKTYSKDLVKEIGLYYTQGMPMDTWAVNEKRLPEEAFLELVNEVFKEKKSMLDFEMKRLNKGVLFCYFQEPDIIQHMFWRYRDPKHPLYEKESPQKYKDMIDSWYQKMDALVGEVMQKMNNNDILIILSDHGFDTFRRVVHINSWLRNNGYLKLKNNARTGRELFQDVDWSKTKAYSFGFGGIYINQIDRESQGIVRPARETEELKKEISQKIRQWRDEKYNTLVINNIYPKEEVFSGPYIKDAPELYLGLNIGYRSSWQTAIGGCPQELVEDNLKKWSGDHLFDQKLIPGILFANFPINSENPSIYDIAPTILEMCGYSEKELEKLELDGKPIGR